MRSHLKALFYVVVVCLLPAANCGREVEPEPPPDGVLDIPGILGGRCASGGFCNEGLLCNENSICIDDPAEGEGEPPCDIDDDQDGSCSDVDCDDNSALRAPGKTERCNHIDDNCNNVLNDDLDCTFLAHDRNTIFRIDPFAGTSTVFLEVTLIDNSAGVLDIDEDVSGNIIAVTSAGLYTVDENGLLIALVDVPAPSGTNGLAITGGGTMFLTNDDGADSAAFKIVDNQLVEVGGFSDGFVSSGDCVATKEEDLLMSAKNPSAVGDPDVLVQIDSATGATTDIGSIGFVKVFGLSASFGFLFGVTDAGQVIEIERDTGVGTLLLTTSPVVRFNGAANGD